MTERPTPKARNGLAIASLALGVTSLVTILLMGSLVGVIAVATGVGALRRVKRGESDRRGVAIAGITLGMLSILIGAAFVFLGAKQAQTGCWPIKEHTGCY